MSEWRYYYGEDEPLSGCELNIGGFLAVVSLARDGFMYWCSFHSVAFVVDIGYTSTRELAQAEVLEKLLSLIDGWKKRTEEELSKVKEVQP